MKKVLQIILLLIILGITAQIIIIAVKNKHNISYEIVVEEANFKINEIFADNQYHLLINKGDIEFSFVIDNKFHKKTKIIEDIIFVSNDGLMCIYPKLYKNKNYNIICNNNGVITSYYALKENSLVSSFVKELTSQGYTNNAWINTNDKKDSINQVTIYYDNLNQNHNIYIWNYTGFYSITKKMNTRIEITNKDVYSNSLGILMGDNYVLPNYDEKYDFTTMLVYNMKSNLVKEIYIGEEVSYDSYYNGYIKDKLYLFDPDSIKQYEIDIKHKSVTVVGNKNINAIYYDDGFVTRNIYDFTTDKLLFKTYETPEEIKNKQNIINENNLYFYTENNAMYMFDNKLKTTVLLFRQSNINSIQVNNSNVYFILKDTLYTYNQQSGIKPLAIYKEFSFNTENMYAVYDY